MRQFLARVLNPRARMRRALGAERRSWAPWPSSQFFLRVASNCTSKTRSTISAATLGYRLSVLTVWRRRTRERGIIAKVGTRSKADGEESMEYLIGVGRVCRRQLIGFDRDRVFYPTLMTVIATYYIFVRRHWEFHTSVGAGVPDSRRFSRPGRDRFHEESLGDRGCPRRTRSFRPLSSSVDSESWCPCVVARLLPFVRRSRRRFPCDGADATTRIRFEGLELRQQHPSGPASGS